ncbi:hypothetical protein OG2516_02094 [Oceanicola granulosus HTCC2516]|uniref:Uncharacterized protein n=1 Tax=Oceanicola granulosus (strain ATCC BAA-861 / DSM 15982 / KCTC 12143 / HTCC2516) TaxID=314256 RepID=Q2CHV5_OCEGH|nr:hypothetical protein [Oceanicola granulosus]EAR52189.1 hypothetical protein OG2516_02094 [Oceanicola granulosus HTCC2516]
MRVTRPILVVLLTLLMLPWGAWAAAASAERAAFGPVIVAESTVETAPARLCRGASLPGSPCAVPVVLPAPAAAPARPGAPVLLPERGRFGEGLAGGGPRRPPRAA